MPLLSSSIVKHQLATVQKVEEALARQSAYGGDLLTNLLEVASLSEERLAGALADSSGLEPAPIGELPRPPERIRRLVPADVAERFACHPLEERDGTLTLAVSEPLPTEVESDLGFALGVGIVQRVAPLVRVKQAVARDYGLELDERTASALARLEGRALPSPSARPRAEPIVAGRPATVAPAPHEREAVKPAAAGPAPTSLKALMKAARPSQARPRRLGPFTAAMAEHDLLDAPTRDDVLRAFFDFSKQYFDYAALFAVHADLAEGRDAHGPGAPRAKVQSIGVPLDLPGVLATARDAQSHKLQRLGGGGLDGALAKDLERRPGPLALFLPVRVRGRTILILYGDHGDQDIDLYAVGDVISFAPLVSSALERLIMQRKRGKAEAHALTSLVPPRRQHPALPGPEERAQALVSMFGGRPRGAPSSIPPEVDSAPAPASPTPPDQTPAPVAAETSASEAASLARPSESPAPPSRGVRPLAPTLGSDRPRDSTPPRSIAEALARPVIPVGPRPSEAPTDPAASSAPVARRFASVPPSVVDAGWEALAGFASREGGTRPGVGSGRAATPKPPPSEDDSPDVSFQAAARDEVLEALAADEASGVQAMPGSRTAAHSARPLPARSAPLHGALPTVIVDGSADFALLIEQLRAGDASASDKLVEAGTRAISALAAAFPGPIEAPSSRRGNAGMPRASECGPVLKTLVRIGAPAVPFVVVRTNDADPTIRGFATRVLGEIPSTDSSRAIARRFFDADMDVRRAALTAARLLSSSPDATSALVAELGLTAEDRMKPTTVRLTSMEVLADLRQAQAVPYLVMALEDNPVDIVQAARRALVTLTRNDFGIDPLRWSEWWRANSKRHRIEWLIDALTHESRDLRRAAGEELKGQTREYFGYYDDLPPLERRQAQDQYREWWETRGKGRFRS